MWVKICANTCLEDALLAAEYGADALGFVFARSPRQVTAQQVREITAGLPPALERVGVFAGSSADEIVRAAETADLTAVQLHSSYEPKFSEAVRASLGPQIGIIQTVHWVVRQDEASARQITADLERIRREQDAPRVLVDAKVGNASGGTGQTFDWSSARPIFTGHPGVRMILAGGLRPENIAAAIQTLQPWGIDVASGVEQTPGRKDPVRLRTFIEKARSASEALRT